MRKRVAIFLLGFFIFQFTSIEMHAGLSVKAAYCAEKEKNVPNDWDFGTVKQGAILRHDFVLKNQTRNTLKINSVHTSCGCTASQADKKSLLPQESTTIKVTFNSRGYSGQVTQFVYVNTDNPDLAIIKFTIKAQVVKD